MLKMLLLCCLFVASLCYALENPMEDRNLFEGDMILEPDQLWDIEHGGNVNPNIPLAATKSYHCPKVIPYSYAADINKSSYAISVIQAAIADYHNYTCLKFVPRTTEKEYLHFYKGRGCSSHVGHYRNRVNWVSLARGCWYKGIVMHEIAHSLGFYHEQSRPDRDHYVKILFENIANNMGYNFKKYGSNIDSMNVPYDYESVMHYGRTAFGYGKTTIQTIDKSKQYVIGQRRGFSKLDILQMNLLYKCPGFTKPPPGTLPPIPTTQPATNPVTTVNSNPFIIRHVGRLCVSVGSDNRLRLDMSCNELFAFTSSNALIHLKTSKCVVLESTGNGGYIKLASCMLSTAQFKQTSGSSIKHVGSGKCFHPQGGSASPRVGTKLVIYNGCDERRLSFTLEYAKMTTAAPIATTAPPTTFYIQHWDGLCVAVNASSNRLFMSKSCKEKFELTASKSLKHIQTGKCVVPESTNSNSFFKLQSDCSTSLSRFQQTAKFSVKHLSTGKCVHPLGGNLRPRAGTAIVIYSGCDESRLQFQFIYG